MTARGLDEFLQQSPLFAGEVIVLEKTENSELAQVLLPCNTGFFERVFSVTGPYWSTYAELGFGEIPFGAKYLAAVDERMYFCKNVEKRFLFSLGLAKKFSYKNSVLKETVDFSLDNFFLLLSFPFNFAKQAASVALASIRINEELEKFEKFFWKAREFWETQKKHGIENHETLAKQALLGAVAAMRFSFYASIAYSLKTKLRNSNAWKECDLEIMSKIPVENEEYFLEKMQNDFGFYSKNPYDVSIPRFSENPRIALDLKGTKFPKNPAARWRENSKFACARYLAVLRNCFIDFGKKTGLGEKVFFLTPSELVFMQNDLEKIALQREKESNANTNHDLPKAIVFDGKWDIDAPVLENGKKEILGLPAGGQRVAVGEAVFVEKEKDYSKDLAGKIVFSKTLSPNLCVLFDKIAGIVSEGGGRTAHAAIVALEQGLPCIVQAKNIGLLKEGDSVRVDGVTGKIEKIR
ncbi:MAG: PEP-utilizing enzyme [archaeon]